MPILNLTDFGATPNSPHDQSPALRRAAAAARAHPGSTLRFPPGTYRVRHDSALRLLDDAIYGRLDPRTMQRPYVPYLTSLDLSHTRDLLIDAPNATLQVEGWMEPVCLSHAQHITLRGLTIAYHRPPASHGRILAVAPDSFDVLFDDDCPVTAGLAAFRVVYIDPRTSRLHLLQSAPNTLIAPQTLRFHRAIDPALASARIAFSHTAHYRAAIMLLNASDITLDHVTIHDHGGMGVVGHHCHNLTLRHLRVIPSSDRCLSTNTDATHFVSCSGTILIEDSTFIGNGDDACNIHNYYYTPSTRHAPDTVDLVVNADGGCTHAHVLDHPDPGDTLALVDRASLQPLAQFTVRHVEPFPDQWRAQATFDRPLPADLTPHLLANISRQPAATIRRCTMLNHRARGLLIKTSHVLIEHCTFTGLTGTPIHLGAEAWWHEASPCANVTIRHNRFADSGYADGTIESAAAIAVTILADKKDRPGLHRHLTIEDNTCDCSTPRSVAIHIGSADDVTLTNNHATNCTTPIQIHHSTNVTIDGTSYPAPNGAARP